MSFVLGGAQGIEQAAKIAGIMVLKKVLEGDREAFHEGMGELHKILEGTVEVGGKVLINGMVEPVTRKAVLGGLLCLVGVGLKREFDDDDDIDDIALNTAKSLLSHPILMKKLSKDSIQKITQEIVSKLVKWVPSKKVFSFVKWLVKTLSLDPVLLGMAPLLEAYPEQLSAFVAYLIASHGSKDPVSDMVLEQILLEARVDQSATQSLHLIESAIVLVMGYKTASEKGFLQVYYSHDSCSDVVTYTASLLNPEDADDDASFEDDKKAQRKQQSRTPASHLSLEGKGLSCLPGVLDAGLRVLYADDNQLTSFDKILFNDVRLSHLYAQNNLLQDITGISGVSSLKKLYLCRNELPNLRGIEELSNLEELHLSRQKSRLDLTSAGGVSSVFKRLKKIRVLMLNAVGLEDSQVQFLSEASGVEELDVSDNYISDPECLKGYLGSASSLVSLKILGNPICKQLKYRDAIVSSASRLALLDNTEVSSRERVYLRQIKQNRKSVPRPAQQPTPDLELTGVAPARTSSARLLKRSSDAPGF
eukprot:TRINITY_DN3755_c0_g1_i1.p1 TRINITY_DN3755_c0_g1~~TRINITY_DN3755_c0_g1_i1.p1  ORF type:complete len:549 (+),score=78.05 TRINITY_DN3755_c0_g1_i1:47-1648(+)